MQKKSWLYKNVSVDSKQLLNISSKLSVSPIIATLLLVRGICDKDTFVAFFKKPMSCIHPPSELCDMDAAAARIISSVDLGEKIVIYGDYDVDGITSTVLLYRFLKGLGANVSYYIPNRSNEGYGINMLAMNKLIKAGFKLMITVDCGISAVGEVEFARLQGMDVIISDHHNCQEKLPKAIAVINPKRPDCDYPFDGLAGVGVALKLVLGIAVKKGMNTTQVFNDLVELAAIGSIADLVPLTDENRIIADRGIKKLQSGSRYPGIAALLEVSGADKYEINSDTIAFHLAPRLNASGRIGSAATSVELLLCDSYEKAKELAIQLNNENKERQDTELEIFNEVMDMISSNPAILSGKVIVLAKENWHQGVIGIVASRLCERFSRPAILISTTDGSGKGSGRSIPSFNLFNALEHTSQCLISFGGHSMAAGLNIRTDDIVAFSEQINKYANDVLTDADMVPVVKIDCTIPASLITLNNIKFLSRLEPFGMGNEAPVFSMTDVEIQSVSTLGTDGKHLRMTVTKDGLSFNCIGFSMGRYFEILRIRQSVDIAFRPNINNYQGKELIQLRLKDIRIT